MTSFHTSSDLLGCSIFFCGLCLHTPAISCLMALKSSWQRLKKAAQRAAELLNPAELALGAACIGIYFCIKMKKQLHGNSLVQILRGFTKPSRISGGKYYVAL